MDDFEPKDTVSAISSRPRKVKVVYYGKECYRNCLGLSHVNCIWDHLPCDRLVYTDREAYTINLDIFNTDVIDTLRYKVVNNKVAIVIFILDSEESFKKIFNLCNSYPFHPILLVCVTNKDFELTPTTKDFMKCLGQLLGDVKYLEYENCEAKQGDNLKFKETIDVQTIKDFYQKINLEWNPILGFGIIRKLLKDNLQKDFTLAMFQKTGMDAHLYYDNCLLSFALKSPALRGCTWWSYTLRNSTTSNSDILFKAEATDYADDLYGRISHVEGDIHSLQFVQQDCNSIIKIIGLLKSKKVPITRLIIIGCTGTPSFNVLSSLPEGLEYLVVVDTKVNLARLIFPPQIVSSLKNLVLNTCDDKTEEIPSIIGILENLEVLDVRNNKFRQLPGSFSNLDRLDRLLIDTRRIVSPPQTILRKSAKEVVQYLKEIQAEEMTENREAKVMVVGEEGVGKSTFVKSLKRTGMHFFNTTPPTKTDGIEISNLQLKGTDCKVYDLAGDVEYLNTHALFFSPNCLHLAVFNLSNFTVSKEGRSTDQFGRLDLWLQTIAFQDPTSYAIIVGTHADHNLLSPEVLSGVRSSVFHILKKYRSQHQSLNTFEECMICNPEKTPTEVSSSLAERPVPSAVSNAESETTSSGVPHILGYFEVSGITNTNIKSLKLKLESSITNIKSYTKTDTIPKRWLRLRKSVLNQLSNEDQLRQQPLLPLATIRGMANDIGIFKNDSIDAMLRFFHSQGDFLWYEEITEMKDIVIVDPQWLSDQLLTLISCLPSVNAVCQGVLHHFQLPELWCNMSEENRARLLALFRSVGLCFSISHDEDLFPCKLPVGWPDREVWPPFPDENQTSLLFEFSFVPLPLFPDLIVAINKKKDSFPQTSRPVYYRFNAVYITKQQGQCHIHGGIQNTSSQAYGAGIEADEPPPSFHRVHMELTPHTNSLKVTIRGPHPCCQVSDITSMIKAVKSQRYPGITYKERLICPMCEIKRLHKPSTFDYQDKHEFCTKGHKVGSTDDILAGKLDTSFVVTSTVGQVRRVMGETLDDHFCPKLFVVLPINLDSLSFKDRFVYSYLRDGYAIHLLCECPDQWHFVSSPGFRVGKPKEFFNKYGKRVFQLLRVISGPATLLKIASAVEPHCRVGATVANAADTMSKELEDLLKNYLEKYPHLEAPHASLDDNLKDLKSSRGLQRSELSRFLEVEAKGRDFGPLICTYVDKRNEWLWLCEEHNQNYEIVERQ